MKCTYRGSFAALPTPFVEDQLDTASLTRLVDFQLAGGSDGLLVAGTSGEASTLTDYERQSALETVLERVAGRVPVLAGVGTNSTATTVERARAAAEAGADGLLVVTPYYNRPNARGQLAHFGALAEAVDLPLVLYNIPARTGLDLTAKTASELRNRHPNIVAIKEAGGNPGRAKELMAGSDLAVFAGEDALIPSFMANGAAGVISVVANLVPAAVAELCRCSQLPPKRRPGTAPTEDSSESEDRIERGAELAAFLHPLTRDLFLETNPAPLKAALKAMGLLASEELRLPLVGISQTTRERLSVSLNEAGLLPAPSPLG